MIFRGKDGPFSEPLITSVSNFSFRFTLSDELFTRIMHSPEQERPLSNFFTPADSMRRENI